MKKIFALALVASSLLFVIHSCEKDKAASGDTIPYVPVSLTINLDLPNYSNLTIPGAYAYIDGGARGVLVVHSFDDDYYAFDRNCSYLPSTDCAQLWVDSTVTTQLMCGSYDNGIFTKCCDSRFEIPSGFPLQGPAQQPMKSFFVSRQGNTLYITN